MRATHPGTKEFIAAWEASAGQMEFGDQRTYPPDGMYQSWRADTDTSHISAADWLEQRGFKPAPEEGATQIVGGWEYSVMSFDANGNWVQDGKRFSAIRSFQFRRGGPMGMMTVYTHREPCGHGHNSRLNAEPCLSVLRDRSAQPSTEDIGRAQAPVKPGLTGKGVTHTLVAQYEGDLYSIPEGLLIPFGDSAGRRGMVQTDWEIFGDAGFTSDGVPRLVLRVARDVEPDENFIRRVDITEFGADGQESWLDLLRSQGLAVANA